MKTILVCICGFLGVLCAGAAEWRNISPDGGRILHVAIDPLNPSTVYAATCAGLFKSVDSGTSWSSTTYTPSPACDPLNRPAAVIVDPRNSGTLYVTGCAPSKSTDGGVTWRPLVVSPDTTTCIQSIAIDPTNSATLYAAGGRIYKSTDGGDSWTVLIDIPDGTLVLVDPQNPSILYATGRGGLLKSVDAGASQETANNGLIGSVEALAVDPTNSSTLYAGSAGHIFRSEDGGASWQERDAGLPLSPVGSTIQNFPVVALVVNPLNPSTIYALLRENAFSSFYFVSSSNGGTTWTIAHNPVGAFDLTAIAVDSTDPSTLYLGTSNGILKTTDGGSRWTQSNSGLKAVSVGSILATSGAVTALNATPRKTLGASLFGTVDGGTTWSVSGLPEFVTQLEPDPGNSLTVYASGETDILKSNNQGVNFCCGITPDDWPIPQNINTGWITSLNDSPLAIDPWNGSTLYRGVTQCSPYRTCDTRVWKSIDSGLNWTPLDSLNGKSCCSYVSQIAVEPQDSAVVYAGTADDNQTGSGLWKSLDGGASWTNLVEGDITGLALHPRDPNTVYIARNCCLYKTTDGGQSWNQASAGLPQGHTGPVLINPANPNILYCVAYDSESQRSDVFRSTDAATTWHPSGSGLSGNVNSIALDRQNPSIVYAGTTTGLYLLPPEEVPLDPGSIAR